VIADLIAAAGLSRESRARASSVPPAVIPDVLLTSPGAGGAGDADMTDSTTGATATPTRRRSLSATGFIAAVADAVVTAVTPTLDRNLRATEKVGEKVDSRADAMEALIKLRTADLADELKRVKVDVRTISKTMAALAIDVKSAADDVADAEDKVERRLG